MLDSKGFQKENTQTHPYLEPHITLMKQSTTN